MLTFNNKKYNFLTVVKHRNRKKVAIDEFNTNNFNEGIKKSEKIFTELAPIIVNEKRTLETYVIKDEKLYTIVNNQLNLVI